MQEYNNSLSISTQRFKILAVTVPEKTLTQIFNINLHYREEKKNG